MTSQIYRYTVPVATGRGEGRRFLGTQTQLGCQTRVGYAGWCTKGTEEYQGSTRGPQRNLEPRAVTRRYRFRAGTRISSISGRAPDGRFQNHRNSGITRRTGGIRRRTPQCRRRTSRGMRRDRNGIRGTREPEENECGRQKKSLEFENRSNSKTYSQCKLTIKVTCTTFTPKL